MSRRTLPISTRNARRPASKKLDGPSHKRGNAKKAFEQAPVWVQAEYRVPVEHHNPMEPFATTAVWEGDGRITAYDKTQGPQNSRNYVAGVCALPRAKVRVLSPYVGGGFGSGLRPQYQLPLAVMAARALKRSLRVTLTRQQMFTLGYRAGIVQELALGANRDGTLVSFQHNAVAMTSQFEDFQRDFTNWSSLLYRCPNADLRQRVVKLDQNTPCDMRAPGGCEGIYAIECAMDELAYAAGIDPLELRLITIPTRTRSRIGPTAAKRCGSAIAAAPRNSAGPSASRSRAPCGTGASWSAGAWPPASGKRCRWRRALARC
jgi:xanthine dehydrogenase YagR molybdenum-binding subunit